MSAVRHLVVGPAQHGVVIHACAVAAATGHELLRCADAAAALSLDLTGAEVVHVPFTDRLFAPTAEDALAAFHLLAQHAAAGGAALSVTLHDVPRGDDALAVRRRATYRGVVRAARGIVVNSRVELAAVEADAADAHSVRAIMLPVEQVPWRRQAPVSSDAVVLGFVYPDRGHDEVLRAVPAGSGVLALGRASAGHEDLLPRLADLAATLGRRWRVSGFVPDAELAAHLAGAAVPIAPNRRVTASGSIATWVGHGRRPLVPDGEYTRELDARWPGALRRYDADDPDALRQAIADALADPASTWLPPGLTPGPSLAEVATDYTQHLGACRRERVVTVAGRAVPPGNRWDLLQVDERAPKVSVVIPYYEDQRALDLVLTALRLQRLPRERIEVIVADDGSAVPPDLRAAGELAARTVRREHDGFGAAAARNLGAAASHGDVLAFLDGDTVPEPDYLAQLVRLPATHPDALVVGRRRHADLTGWSAPDVRAWLSGERARPAELADPAWLRTAYRDTRDLLAADSGSYRYVISAVLAMHRSLFERLGGFSERFTSYGGEDWELANRAWHAGALVAHVPTAVAWHDGPDWAERAGIDRRAAKNAETFAVSALLPDPSLRGGGQWLPYCRTVVLLAGSDAAGVLVSARTAFAAGADCGFWLDGPGAAQVAAQLADPRIQAGPPPPDVLARAGVTARLHGPADLSDLDALAELALRRGLVVTPALTLRSSRASARCRDAGCPDELIATLFGRHDRSAPALLAKPDLGRVLARQAQPVRRR